MRIDTGPSPMLDAGVSPRRVAQRPAILTRAGVADDEVVEFTDGPDDDADVVERGAS